jgi:DNA-binding response OmpR family regulator
LFGTATREGTAGWHTINLVLLALRLPQVSGLEVLRTLRNHSDTKALPIIVLACTPAEPDIAEATRLGANACMVRPLEFAKLVDVMCSLRFDIALLNRPANVMG